MYKVFLNNKLICLNEIDSNQNSKTNVYVFADKSMLKKEIRKFEKSNNKQLNVVHTSLDELWNIFKSIFWEIDAAGGLVKNAEGKYLFIFRRGKWDLPKGKVEKKEKIEHAAMREVQEECGIKDLKIINELIPTYHIYYKSLYKVLKKTYWFEMVNATNEKPIPQAKEDITIAKWLDKSEVSEIYENTYESIKEVINFSI